MAALCLAGIIASGTANAADPTYYFTTDITGAQTQIDINHLSSWIVGVSTNSSIEVIGGQFTMKDGSQTSGSLTFSIYTGALTDADITSGTNNPFASITLSNDQFDAQAGSKNSGQQFYMHTFNFASVVTLMAGQTYTAALTSVVPDVQSEAYFIKGGSQVFLRDSATGATNTNSLSLTGGSGAVANTSAPAAVPEPSTYALFGLGGLLLLVAFHRRTA